VRMWLHVSGLRLLLPVQACTEDSGRSVMSNFYQPAASHPVWPLTVPMRGFAWPGGGAGFAHVAWGLNPSPDWPRPLGWLA
jgi:hypothetical protein